MHYKWLGLPMVESGGVVLTTQYYCTKGTALSPRADVSMTSYWIHRHVNHRRDLLIYFDYVAGLKENKKKNIGKQMRELWKFLHVMYLKRKH